MLATAASIGLVLAVGKAAEGFETAIADPLAQRGVLAPLDRLLMLTADTLNLCDLLFDVAVVGAGPARCWVAASGKPASPSVCASV